MGPGAAWSARTEVVLEQNPSKQQPVPGEQQPVPGEQPALLATKPADYVHHNTAPPAPAKSTQRCLQSRIHVREPLRRNTSWEKNVSGSGDARGLEAAAQQAPLGASCCWRTDAIHAPRGRLCARLANSKRRPGPPESRRQGCVTGAEPPGGAREARWQRPSFPRGAQCSARRGVCARNGLAFPRGPSLS